MNSLGSNIKINSGNVGTAFVFRSFAQSDIVTISNTGNIAGNGASFSGNIDCGGGITLTGSNATSNISSVDNSNISNTYLTLKPNISNNDWCYFRQIGSDMYSN